MVFLNRPEKEGGRFAPPSELEIRLGGLHKYDDEPDVVYAFVSKVIPHPDLILDLDHNNISADIALLKLTRPVTYTDTIRPICLPSADVDLDQFKVCVNTGFGETDWGGW